MIDATETTPLERYTAALRVFRVEWSRCHHDALAGAAYFEALKQHMATGEPQALLTAKRELDEAARDLHTAFTPPVPAGGDRDV